ncbi:MAG: hypothetical protein AAFZ65_00105 [Planctomycetota bacterium]
MTEILVLFASDRGHTLRAAEAVADGAAAVPSARSRLLDVDHAEPSDLERADGVLLGIPVRMGSAHWRIKRFTERICGPLWSTDRCTGGVGAVFATCGGYGGAGGGGELALLTGLATLAQLGLLLVPLPRGTAGFERGGLHWGPLLRTADDNFRPRALDTQTLTVAQRHGAHVARVAAALEGRRSHFDLDCQSDPVPRLQDHRYEAK